MAKIATQGRKLSGVLAYEEMPEYGACREVVTVVVEAGMDVGAALVSNGSGKYVWIEAADVATLNADVVVLVETEKNVKTLAAGDHSLVVLARGKAGIVGKALQYKDALSAPQKATVIAAFKAKEIRDHVQV